MLIPFFVSVLFHVTVLFLLLRFSPSPLRPPRPLPLNLRIRLRAGESFSPEQEPAPAHSPSSRTGISRAPQTKTAEKKILPHKKRVRAPEPVSGLKKLPRAIIPPRPRKPVPQKPINRKNTLRSPLQKIPVTPAPPRELPVSPPGFREQENRDSLPLVPPGLQKNPSEPVPLRPPGTEKASPALPTPRETTLTPPARHPAVPEAPSPPASPLTEGLEPFADLLSNRETGESRTPRLRFRWGTGSRRILKAPSWKDISWKGTRTVLIIDLEVDSQGFVMAARIREPGSGDPELDEKIEGKIRAYLFEKDQRNNEESNPGFQSGRVRVILRGRND